MKAGRTRVLGGEKVVGMRCVPRGGRGGRRPASVGDDAFEDATCAGQAGECESIESVLVVATRLSSIWVKAVKAHRRSRLCLDHHLIPPERILLHAGLQAHLRPALRNRSCLTQPSELKHRYGVRVKIASQDGEEYVCNAV